MGSRYHIIADITWIGDFKKIRYNFVRQKLLATRKTLPKVILWVVILLGRSETLTTETL